jgi:polyhydroxyalkanoate synthesis regulator phasin
MKLNRWLALPVAGLAAVAIGVAAVQAAPSPSPSPSGSKNYAQVFVDKLAAILHLNSTQTRDALKQAGLQTVDQMLKDGKITQRQADAMKAKINAGQGLGPIGGFGLRPGGFKADRALIQELTTAKVNAAAGALHMSATDFKNALKSGKSLTDLETQQKVSDSAVKSAVKNAAKGVLDKAVKAGTITQAQADTLLSRVGSGLNFRPKLGHRGPGTPASPSPSPKPSGAAFYSTI